MTLPLNVILSAARSAESKDLLCGFRFCAWVCSSFRVLLFLTTNHYPLFTRFTVILSAARSMALTLNVILSAAPSAESKDLLFLFGSPPLLTTNHYPLSTGVA